MIKLEKQVAILGAAGMLGTALREVFKYSILLDVRVPNERIRKADIRSVDSLRAALGSLREKDWVINAVAYKEVDNAETDKGSIQSYHLNVQGSRNLAELSSAQGFKIIHISTAYVFDGDKGLYKETDTPNPLNTYGLHKLQGEEPILEARGIVLRTDCLYGPNGSDNFVDTMVRLAREKAAKKENLPVVFDQIGSPAYTLDLALITYALITGQNKHKINAKGRIYHAVNNGRVSRAELAKEIINTLGINCNVEEITTGEYNERFRKGKVTAVRPRDCSLSTEKLGGLGINPRGWREALVDYLKELRQ